MSTWQVQSSKVTLDNPWYKVQQDNVLSPGGREYTFHVIRKHRPSVFMVVQDDQQRVLLLRQYRYSIDREMWQVPAGHNEDETPLETAQRELAEETGLMSDTWVEVGQFYTAVGIANIASHAFLATSVQADAAALLDEAEEILEQRWVSWDELDRMMADGRICSSEVMAVLHMARAHLARA
jgi:8-oxo-dGTP pyrophosphatase MutT (NUDIX family)